MFAQQMMPWMHRETQPLPVPSDGRDREIKFEQISNVYRDYLSGIVPATVGGLLLAVVLWPYVSHTRLLAWLALLSAVTVVRTIVYLRFMSAQPKAEDIERWKWGFLIGTASSGAAWGSTAFVMSVPGPLPIQMFLLSCLFAVCSGAVSVFGHFLPAFRVFALLLVVPTVLLHVAQGDPIHWVIAAIACIFLLSFLGFAQRHSRFVEQSLRMRHENRDLIVELREQKLAAEVARNDAQRATQEAEQANRAKSHFLATASHDLRQPLQAIALFSEALRQRIYYPEVRSIVDNINASVGALQSLFNELLDISRLEAGVIQPIPVHFRVAVLLDKLRTDYTPAAQEKQLRIRVAPSEYVLFTDPMLLERVVRNFVANAIRYTPNGGTLIVGCRRQNDGRIHIEVRDNGIGIAADQQGKIFEEFYQVDNPERDRRNGFGLGLAIAKGVKDILGCDINLKSAPGRGSVFSISVERGAAATPKVRPAVMRKKQNLRGRTVMVIDDDREVREAMELVLADWGCQVVSVTSASEAIEKIASTGKKPDLLVVDYRLRGGTNGIDAVTAIRAALGTNVPAVLVTGDTGVERLREVRESGLAVLHKPVVIAQLNETLNLAVESHQ